MNLLLISAVALALTTSVADASTRVAVIELGATGTVRRTTTSNRETSVDGVASFWSALHGYGRKLQHAGMPVVPDLFSRPDSGIVVGLTGVDLDNMPTLNNLMNDVDASSNSRVVGHMNVPGKQCKNMMKNVKHSESLESTTAFSSSFKTQAQESGISGIEMEVTSENASDMDALIASLINDASFEEGKTIVLHLIVEEEDGAARRRNLARRLEGRDLEGEENGEEDNADGQNNGQNNGFYGYGYYNAYGEWVTPYKTMFQIQYFNVVLWTAVGLVAILFFSIYLMVYMPLMADTLLFGESARVAYDD